MQSNKQSNSSFYQNQTKINFIKVLIEKYENKFTYQNNLMIASNQRLISLIIKHLQSLKAKLNELENTKVTPQIENEIQTIDNQIQVTQTQINRLTKLNSFATLLQKKSNKKSFYKYRQILLSIRNKTDLKQRVLNLLVWEKERLIKVA
jgi:CHAT domain-containing protein